MFLDLRVGLRREVRERESSERVQKLQMEAQSTLIMFQIRDTVEFYPRPTLDMAFGRTRSSCRNPIWLILKFFRLLEWGVIMGFKRV